MFKLKDKGSNDRKESELVIECLRNFKKESVTWNTFVCISQKVYS